MTQNGYGLPLNEAAATTLLTDSCRLATPFNIEALRALALRADKRARDYNATLSSTEAAMMEQRWVMWAAARNAKRRLELALRRVAA